MAKIKPYSKIEVKLLQEPKNPKGIINLASNITMKKDFEQERKDITSLVDYLVKSNHTSLFEHLNYTFLIKGASRSFLAQMTRHRIASYTSGSQHYQNYKDYGFKVSKNLANSKELHFSLYKVMKEYKRLVDLGVERSEARQILPNGMENNLIVTINARSLGNFFNLRLCNRNVEEMRIVSGKMHDKVKDSFPEYFRHTFPDCVSGKCTQGKMRCSEKSYKRLK